MTDIEYETKIFFLSTVPGVLVGILSLFLEWYHLSSISSVGGFVMYLVLSTIKEGKING